MIEVRNRQHEFQNHLTALQGMAYTCHTLEELVEMQNQYCDRIVVEKSGGRIIAQNIEKEGQNWLLMQVVLPFKGEK